MNTMQLAAHLFQLQQLDLELDRLRSELQAIATALQGDTRLRKLRLECSIAQQQVQAALQQQKDAEWHLEDIQQRLQTQEQRLNNGTVAHAKELQALQQAVQHLHAQQSRQEEVTLEIIDTVEALQEEAERKHIALQQAESEWQKETAALTMRHDELEARLRDATRKREQLAGSIENSFVTRYMTLRRTKQGHAISRIDKNSCQWCRVILAPSELQRVRTSSELQTCMNCGRILYY
ncbi:MAG TPA: C4-type zinc ribbon domain-containing protein, partial [Ktedonobacteraceae bacterium]